jgi:hypothetical protein
MKTYSRNATHVLPARSAIIKNRWDHAYVERRKVIVMAVAEGFAMVRVRGGEPYVAPVNQIEGLTPPP